MTYSVMFLLGCWVGCILGIALSGLTASARDRETAQDGQLRTTSRLSSLDVSKSSLAVSFEDI